MLKEELKLEIKNSTLSRNSRKTSLLKFILGEYERMELAGNKPEINKIIVKTIESNNVCLTHGEREEFKWENEILNSYLPKYASVEELRQTLTPLGLDNSGKSIGLAMKHLKNLGIAFKNEDVINAL